ncbi:MAG: hypothetical protein U0105_13195 [Candidatus Obscuribacterales bacterium]
MAKILVAHTAEGQGFLTNALADHTVSYAKTMEEAIRLLESESFSLIVCGMQFDDSRMFDLLRHCKSNPKHRDVPFGCVRLVDSNYSSPVILESLEIASKALGATAFLDLVTAQGSPVELVRNFINTSLASNTPVN